ncbi:MAG: carboxypeptidase regulatory-like domain-containing protein [Candidatus Omnitrophica bacterium]|nr:carboxypeptidase regulatory-like domain-containing protein [Candidatus Omnitrophota bacterium]
MLKRKLLSRSLIFVLIFIAATASAQQVGLIRGIVYDVDFDAPLPAAEITIVEKGLKTIATDEGNFSFKDVAPGDYTLIFSKDGYTRLVETEVKVLPGEMTEVDASLSGAFTEMEEFFVRELIIGGATEAGLLQLRIESPALLDSISSELMSQAGAGDAASALRLVSGATVQDGKFAVIRGLPDRYVNAQMNTVRLPSADPDKRAVQLDQFPSGVIESIQVSKTFTPDQQGDASGGAVNVVLKGLPEEKIYKVKVGSSYNSQYSDQERFLSYEGGGVDFWGNDDGDRDIPDNGNFYNPQDINDAVGVNRIGQPMNYNFAMTAGDKREIPGGFRVGGFVSIYYKRDSAYRENGIDDSYWVANPGDPMTPREVSKGAGFETALFNISQGSEEVQLGGLGAVGIENDEHAVTCQYMFTRTTEDKAKLAEDTRGKPYFFPGYDVNDPHHVGNQADDEYPYVRTHALTYTERTTDTFQLNGDHTLPFPRVGLEKFFITLRPKIDWTVAKSMSRLNQPDKRLFGVTWAAPKFQAGFPFWGIPDRVDPGYYLPYKPAANVNMGNYQRVWKDVTEDSEQYFANWKFLFEQWSGDEGYAKFGVFHDEVKRKYDQDTYSNFGESTSYNSDWEDYRSDSYPDGANALITESEFDVDYEGGQEITAWYYMIDLPVWSFFNVIGGVRYERTQLTVAIEQESLVEWIPPGTSTSVPLIGDEADVSFQQQDVLPSMGFAFKFLKYFTLRGSRSETVARQTFKELTPIQQQEYLGADVFIGNPELEMSRLKNYDLRFDYKPYEGGLVSVSWFLKKIKKPIEYVQKRSNDYGYTTPVNYPHGILKGYEIEVRQGLGRFWDVLSGLSVGGNATLIQSQVSLPADEQVLLNALNIQAPMTNRDMLNAPDHLFNYFLTYDWERFGIDIGIFYTVKGDTLVVGAGQAIGNYLPNVYALEYGTLNFSLSKKIGESGKLTFQAKNLLDPQIQEAYRADVLDEDTIKTSYQKGVGFSFSFSLEF